jgi:hypothetical protein
MTKLPLLMREGLAVLPGKKMKFMSPYGFWCILFAHFETEVSTYFSQKMLFLQNWKKKT